MPSTTLRLLLEAAADAADFVNDNYPATNAAGSVEPMRRADHKSKKHGRPHKTAERAGKPSYFRNFPRKARDGEEIGGGHFVFRRGDGTGRIRPCMWPFEHPSMDSALVEAARLAVTYGGKFDVMSTVASASGDKPVVNDIEADDATARDYIPGDWIQVVDPEVIATDVVDDDWDFDPRTVAKSAVAKSAVAA